MDKSAVEKRIAELRKALEQIQANGNATIGAIAECERWLKQMNDEDKNGTANPVHDNH